MKTNCYRVPPFRAVLLAAGLVSGLSHAAGAEELQTIAEIEAAAIEEGTLVWYGAMRSEHVDAIAERFMQDYPEITVQTIRLTSGEITARILTEHRGGHYNADFASASSFAIAQLNAEGRLQPFILPEEAAQNLAEGTYDPEGYWVSQYALTFPVSYNPQKLEAEGLEVPTSFEDFTAPEWAGQFAVSSAYYDWYQGLVEALGREEAFDLATRMAANRPLVRDTSGTILQLLMAGEFAASFHIYGYNTLEEREAGRPADFVNLDPIVVSLQTGGILIEAPNPNAAKLFQIWFTREETQLFIENELGRTSTHRAVEGTSDIWAPELYSYQILDPDEQVATAREFQSEYNRIFGIGR